MTAGKVAVSLVSVLLVVGVVVGVVVMVKPNEHHKDSKSTQATMRTVTAICEFTEYKDSCASSLEHTAKNSSATPKEFIMAMVDAALGEVKKALETTDKVSVDKHKDEFDYEGVQDCKNLLDTALDRLDMIIDILKSGNSSKLMEEEQNLLAWVTGVYSAQTTCLDFLKNPEIKTAIQKAIGNSTQFAHNAVNIMARLPELVSFIDLTYGGGGGGDNKDQKSSPESPGHRRLLTDTDEEGLPTWLSASDRRLLASNNNDNNNNNNNKEAKPNAVVAKDGSGQFQTIAQAIASYPKKHQGKFIIYVKSGTYNEQILIEKDKKNIFIYGDGIGKTIITGNKNTAIAKINTMNTATFGNEADGFLARGITFRNDIGPEGHQAVAFRNKGDMVALFDCSFEGYQDTLYYQIFRIFIRNCRIYGTIDFIFGKGQALLQDNEIIVRKPLPNQANTVTSDGKEIKNGSNGLVIQNCKIVPDQALYPQRMQIPTFLGRPWTPLSTTVLMQSELGDFIRPEGWKIWDGANYHKTCKIMEYANRGPGAAIAKRTKEFAHFRVIDAKEAAQYTAAAFLTGKKWLPQTPFPHKLEL